jgi:hypothetical protein
MTLEQFSFTPRLQPGVLRRSKLNAAGVEHSLPSAPRGDKSLKKLGTGLKPR